MPDDERDKHVLRPQRDDERRNPGEEPRGREGVSVSLVQIEHAGHDERGERGHGDVLEQALEPRRVSDVTVQHDRQRTHEPRSQGQHDGEQPELRDGVHDGSPGFGRSSTCAEHHAGKDRDHESRLHRQDRDEHGGGDAGDQQRHSLRCGP